LGFFSFSKLNSIIEQQKMALLIPPCFEIIKYFNKKKTPKNEKNYTNFLNISIHG